MPDRLAAHEDMARWSDAWIVIHGAKCNINNLLVPVTENHLRILRHMLQWQYAAPPSNAST
jgi:hypothetical protein